MKQRSEPTAASPAAPRPGADTAKQREIRFNSTPPGQMAQAMKLLSGLDRLHVAAGEHTDSLRVEYDLTDYTFEGLEQALAAQGFHLDNSLYMKLVRAVVHFCEETQLRNLRSPERLIKKSNEIYVQAYAHHPHGDHDEMPPELREYK